MYFRKIIIITLLKNETFFLTQIICCISNIFVIHKWNTKDCSTLKSIFYIHQYCILFSKKYFQKSLWNTPAKSDQKYYKHYITKYRYIIWNISGMFEICVLAVQLYVSVLYIVQDILQNVCSRSISLSDRYKTVVRSHVMSIKLFSIAFSFTHICTIYRLICIERNIIVKHIHMYACGKKWLNNDHDDDDECEHITWEICYVYGVLCRGYGTKKLSAYVQKF